MNDKNEKIISKIELDDNFTIYLGGGCNSVVLTSQDAEKALVVDTKYFKGAKILRQEIRAKEITIINTHSHIDHARGNKLYPDAYVISGDTIWWQGDLDTDFGKHPDKIMRPGEEIILNIDREKVHVLNLGEAHSPNDCVVYFEERKLLMAGDLVFTHMDPVLSGSNKTLWMQALKEMKNKYTIATLIPGHGNITERSAILELEAYFNSIAEGVDIPEMFFRN